jgi:hypothetical protein
MSENEPQGRLRKRIKAKIATTRGKIEKRKIVMVRAVVRQDVMVAPFTFINQIFQENGWMSMFTSNKVLPRLVREFCKNLVIEFRQQHYLVLTTTVRG